jgi:toxin ParE1/3/4
MSSPNNYVLILSPQAIEDYEDILSYTLQMWGEEQLAVYDEMLDKALGIITEDPARGRKHRKLSAEYKYYHVGRHYIIYRLAGLEVQVVRILHDKMDIARHI